MSDLSPRSQPVLCDPARQSLFCDALSISGNVRLACEAAAISPQTAYRARRANPAFAQVWDAAMLLAREAVAQVLADRALNGVEEVIFYRGEEIGHRKRYDSRLLLAHLARLDRLAEQADTAAVAQDFDAALASLERGEGQAEQEVPLTEAALLWLEANGVCDYDEQCAYLEYTRVVPGIPLEPLPGRGNPPRHGEGDQEVVEGHPVDGTSSPACATPNVPLRHPADGAPPPAGEDWSGEVPPDPHDFRRFEAPKRKRSMNRVPPCSTA